MKISIATGANMAARVLAPKINKKADTKVVAKRRSNLLRDDVIKRLTMGEKRLSGKAFFNLLYYHKLQLMSIQGA